jgi:hypothetical protein
MFDCNLCQREALYTLDSSTTGSTTLARTTGSIRVVGTMGHAPREALTRLDWMDGDVAAGRLESSPGVVLMSTDLRSRTEHICRLSRLFLSHCFPAFSVSVCPYRLHYKTLRISTKPHTSFVILTLQPITTHDTLK